MQMHASCAARHGQGVLVLGPAGSGKSSLILALITSGFMLVADDRVDVSDGVAHGPPSLAGLLEVRGAGIIRLPYLRRAVLRLIVQIGSISQDLWTAAAGSGPRHMFVPGPQAACAVGVAFAQSWAASRIA